jgi:multiple sugar transport system ATP-binding protein
MEPMAMADKIAVMNHGIIEQFGTPQEIYNRPASMYVADFIGSPPMNFLRFVSSLHRGKRSVTIADVDVAMPKVHEELPEGELALGIRPEHIRLSDQAPLRGSVYGSEYLGTNQIVTVETGSGMLKARVPANRNFKIGENVGIELDHEKLSLFDCKSGRAILSALYSEAHDG